MLIGWPGGDWQATAKLVGLLIGSYLFILWLASILWVYRDVRSRSHDPVTHLVALVIAISLPVVGLPVYFVLRPEETLRESYDRQLEQEAILSELHAISACPNCRRPVRDEFMVCAFCANPLRQPCTSCGQLLQFAWRNCPYCATPRPQAQRTEARRAEAREPRYEPSEPAAMDLRSERRAAAASSAASSTTSSAASSTTSSPRRAEPDASPTPEVGLRASLRNRPRSDEGATPR
jgi:hypothetical protein